MNLTIVPVYASLLVFFFVFLSIKVIRARRSNLIPLGGGGEKTLSKAIRAHGNFAEYTPVALLMLSFVELLYQSPVWLHFLCGMLFVGRIVHAYGISQTQENFKYRVSGMVLTFLILVSCSGLILFHCCW